MAMTKFEKRFVNRQRKAERNIDKVRQRLQDLDIQNIHEALELGCGIGAVSDYLSRSYQMDIVGTDFDPEQVDIARSLYGGGDHLRFQVEDASDLSFNDASFDLVISQNVFHHIPAWEKAIQEISRVLRDRGYFLWLDLAYPALLKSILRPLGDRYGLYTFQDVESEFQHNGFERLFYERLIHGPFKHHHLVLQKA